MLISGNIDTLKKLINSKVKIVLTSHTNPDGDAIGSLLAMYHYLRKLGNDVVMVVPNKFPDYYRWLPYSDKILIYNRSAKLVQKFMKESDVIFSLDYNALNRLGALTEIIQTIETTRVLIDHHVDPELKDFDYSYTTTETSSTGELVYNFIEMMGDVNLVDKQISEAIYTGIVTDTGSFSFSCNRPETYTVTAKLVEKGVDAQKIHKLIYDTFSENRLRLLGFSITERMIVWEELHTALIYLTKDDLRNYRYKVGDTEGIVNYPLSMDKVNLSVLLTEKDNTIRLSFRSKGEFSVNALAREHFNGGGHKNAAGGKLSESIEEVITKLKDVLEEYKNDLNYKLTL